MEDVKLIHGDCLVEMKNLKEVCLLSGDNSLYFVINSILIR